jgi:hypothetical protein
MYTRVLRAAPISSEIYFHEHYLNGPNGSPLTYWLIANANVSGRSTILLGAGLAERRTSIAAGKAN